METGQNCLQTTLAAAHGFLPGALKGVLQTVSEFTGFSQSVVLQIVLTVSPGLCLTACFHHKRWHIVVHEPRARLDGAFVPKDGGGFVVFALFPQFKSEGEIVILCPWIILNKLTVLTSMLSSCHPQRLK